MNVRQIAPGQALEDLPLRLLKTGFPHEVSGGETRGWILYLPRFFFRGNPGCPVLLGRSLEVTEFFGGDTNPESPRIQSPFGASNKIPVGKLQPQVRLMTS